jgi:hypothetical protein
MKELSFGDWANFRDDNDLDWSVHKYIGEMRLPNGKIVYVSSGHMNTVPETFVDSEIRVFIWDKASALEDEDSEDSDEETLPNGFNSYSDTLCWISYHLALIMNGVEYDVPPALSIKYEMFGMMWISDAATAWALEFERMNAGRDWDGEWYEELESFVTSKILEYKA